MEIRLIGAVEAVRDGHPVALPGRRVRALLAVLALSAGRVVGVDTLARAIWDDDPPERIRGSLQTYVGRLRRVLGADLLDTERQGYVLRVPRSAVDLLAFADAVEDAASDDPDIERSALHCALASWTDEPFGTPPSEWLARHEAPAWTERYLQAVERAVDLDLAAGDYARCILELNGQVERHPLRETLWVGLLTALDHAGRTAEALDRYESVRKRLAKELGVDPSPELRAVYQTLLAKSDELATAAPTSPVERSPHQLPPAVRGFVGRDDLRAELDRRADDGAMIALHGRGGSGKTSLAICWAQDNLDRFPDGQLYLNLCGYGPGEPLPADRALDRLLRGLGVPAGEIPASTDERTALLRSVQANRKLLVLLDNARDEDHVRPLLASGLGVTFVTSRNQLRSLVVREGVARLGVHEMAEEESIRLLRQRLGREHPAAELAELAEHCGHLPLALAVAAERLERDGARPLDDLNAGLRDRRQRLALLSTGDDALTNVRAVLEGSYHALDEDTALAFRAVGMYEGPQVTAAAVASIAALDVRDAEARLDRLVEQNLLTALGRGWYACHDLLRDVAVELGVSKMPAQLNSDAMDRLRNWCLHSARNASHTINPPRSAPVPLPLLDGVTPEVFDSAPEAHEWFATHESYLLQVIDEANVRDDQTGYHLAREVFVHLNMQGRLGSSLAMYEQAEQNARRAGHLLAQAECANCVAAVYSELGDHESALAVAHRTRDLYARADEPSGVIRAELNIALTLARLNRLDESVTRYENVVDAARRQGHPLSYAMGLAGVASVYLSIGRTDDARYAAAGAVSSLRDSGNPRALAYALERLGDAQAADHRSDEAIATYEEAAELMQRIGAASFAAGVLRDLGTVYRRADRLDEARTAWRRALVLLAETGFQSSRDVNRDEIEGLLESLPEGAGSQ
ncbi:winged helix-turn-helix domain-containing protein [Nocardioidaceae bacterium SCSIO 66511]|nr:winged helix-turn-helix domain-containing protein [Nocardioidaceae bacterium SCSIO 66511]